MIIFDTCFLIDLEREVKRSKPGSAHKFIESQYVSDPHLSIITLGELYTGCYNLDEVKKIQAMTQDYSILPIGDTTAWLYGEINRNLLKTNEYIGDNDIWISAHCIEYDAKLVTRNSKHFSGIDSLQVVGY